MRDTPYMFKTLLVSYAEDNVLYLNSDFECYVENSTILLKSLRLAKKQVSKRVKCRRCSCTSAHCEAFHTILLKHFGNTTLLDFLSNGDSKQLDNFSADVMLNFLSFDIYDVITAYHKVRHLKNDLLDAKDKIVVNPFLTVSDLEASDSD